MLSSPFKLKIVCGLSVLCVFHSFFADAVKIPFKVPSETNILRRGIAHHTSMNSMMEINLNSRTSSSTIFRSVSSPTLNIGKTPSIMREMSHKEAASILNVVRSSPQLRQRPPLIQRMKPSQSTFETMGKYLKNGAITTAGAGGVLVIVNAFDGDKHGKEEKKEPNGGESRVNGKRAFNKNERSPVIYDPLGLDKKMI